MPTGGVKPEEENLKKWFEAGVHCVGMGSQLMAKNEAGHYDYDAIREKAKYAMEVIRAVRGR